MGNEPGDGSWVLRGAQASLGQSLHTERCCGLELHWVDLGGALSSAGESKIRKRAIMFIAYIN